MKTVKPTLVESNVKKDHVTKDTDKSADTQTTADNFKKKTIALNFCTKKKRN